MKKVILAAGLSDKDKSYEYHNFFKPLEAIGCNVIGFDFPEQMRLLGREGMNQKLLEVIRCEQPDIVLFTPRTDQFIPEIIDEIGKHTITIGYLFDDMWRIEYSRFWAKHFNFITTSDVNGLRKFQDVGVTNVIYSPFACNHEVYHKENMPKRYDVTFVGQYHPQREWYINRLKKYGFEVRVWGAGWPGKILSMPEMINVFNQSRINLNLSNCISWDIRYLTALSRPLKSTLRVWSQAVRALTHPDIKIVEQMKGRHFEINACGGFQLSYYVEGLERHYDIGEEIALFVSPEDLIEKIRYYLKHEDEREAIALRGYKRTLKDHTMEQRLRNIMQVIHGKIKV